MPPSRSMAVNPLFLPNSMPSTHWVGLPWFFHCWKPKPTCLATASIEFSIPSRKGIELEVGIDSSFLPCMQAFASKGGPGETNSGILLWASTIACAAARSGPSARAGPQSAPVSAAAAARAKCFSLVLMRGPPANCVAPAQSKHKTGLTKRGNRNFYANRRPRPDDTGRQPN